MGSSDQMSLLMSCIYVTLCHRRYAKAQKLVGCIICAEHTDELCKILDIAKENDYKIYTDFDATIRLMVSFLDGTRSGVLTKNQRADIAAVDAIAGDASNISLIASRVGRNVFDRFNKKKSTFSNHQPETMKMQIASLAIEKLRMASLTPIICETFNQLYSVPFEVELSKFISKNHTMYTNLGFTQTDPYQTKPELVFRLANLFLIMCDGCLYVMVKSAATHVYTTVARHQPIRRSIQTFWRPLAR